MRKVFNGPKKNGFVFSGPKKMGFKMCQGAFLAMGRLESLPEYFPE